MNNVVRAIMSGDINALRALLNAGAPPDGSKLGSRIPPLHHAVSLGRIEMVRLLIERGADINATGTEGITTLSVAVLNAGTAVTRVLLELGADPNHGKKPPLAFAIYRDDIEMVKLLLSFGANPNIDCDEPRSATSPTTHRAAIQELLAAHQGTDWHEAVKRGDIDLIRARLDLGADVDARNPKGETALHLAARAGQVDIVQRLLDRGADANAANGFGQTPLMLAIIKEQTEVVRVLVARGADVHAATQWGRTPIFSAASKNRREIRDILIAAGAKVGIVEAAMMGDRGKVMAFLADGVPVDHRNEADMTALMAAAEQGDVELAISLHERGADVNVFDKRESSPLIYAARNAAKTGSTDLLDLLLHYGADVNACGSGAATALYVAITLRDEKVVRFLLTNGADPNQRMLSAGWTALHAAIQMGRGDIGCVRALLDHGADVERADNSGTTPLMAAVKLAQLAKTVNPTNGSEYIREIVRLLIERGANVNASSKTASVLGLAATAGDTEVVRLLLDAGANPSDNFTLTPMIRASMHGHQDIVALLRERGAPALGAGDAQKGIHDEFITSMMGAALQSGYPAKIVEVLNRLRQKQ